MRMFRTNWISLLFTKRIPNVRWQPTTAFSMTSALNQTTTTLKNFEDIPGPVKIPYFKSSWVFLPVLGQYDISRVETSYMKIHAKYGKMARFEVPNEPSVVFIFDRELTRKVYNEEGHFPNRPGLRHLLKYRTSRLAMYPNVGLFLLQNQEWKDLRSLGQRPMLRIPSVRLYLNSMENVSKDFIERLREVRDNKMEVHDIFQELVRWALESVGVFALHKRLGCLDKNLAEDSEPQRLIKAVNESFITLYELEMAGGWKTVFPKKTYEKLVAAQDYFTTMTQQYLKEALDEIKTRDSRKEGGETYLLDKFLESKMSLDQIKGIVMDLFFAGIDTTSSTIAFTLYYMASLKDKQQKLHEEISRVLPNKDSPITAETLDNVPYLRAFVKETLRLNPITVGTARILDHDIALGGYNVPKGTILFLVLTVTSRLPEYFELPNQFLPERWLEGSTPEERSQRKSVGLKETYESKPFASVPFSHGVRMCIGRRFAEQEIYILLLKILQNFTLEYHHKPIGTLQRLINLPDRPVHVVFKEK